MRDIQSKRELQNWLDEPRPELVAAVADGVRAHVHGLRSRGLEFYGYALLPGELYDINSLIAATNTETDIKVSRSDPQYRYYRYSVDEWVHYDRGAFVAADALLMEANERFRSMHPRAGAEDMMDDFEIAHATVLLDCIVQGLEAARASGVFGWSEPFLAVWISDSGSEVMLESVQRLNSPAVWTEFLTEFGS